MRLAQGEVCEACRSEAAWARYERDEKLVLDRAEIDRVNARRAWRERAILPRAGASLTSIGAVLVAAVMVAVLIDLYRARELGPLIGLVEQVRRESVRVFFAGLAVLALGIVSLRYLHRRAAWAGLIHLACFSFLTTSGAAGLLGGAWRRLSAPTPRGFEYLSMPSSRPAAVLGAQRSMNATVVLLAPDETGDASNTAIGTGAIIVSEPHRAWVVTCSHVVMPYISPAAYRDPASAQPVWAELADGRSTKAHVRWTAPPPLDVALVEVPISAPPESVELSPNSEAMVSGTLVSFVPNPYRNGWKLHRGTVEKRQTHETPAGTFALLYTNLPVQPGDSGSGLFDEQSRLVGLNTWTRYDPAGPLGVSLPSEAMRAIIVAIAEGRIDRLDTELVNTERSP